MYKYIRYIGILLFTVFRKVFGLVWYFVAVPFRGYARNTVYNYVLQNGIYLKRLLERPLDENMTRYIIEPYHGSDGGWITKRKISKLEYYFVYWLLWGWLDDDSNYDTFTDGYNNTIISGERFKWMPKFIIGSLLKANNKLEVFGNSFDIGDKRALYPHFSLWASYLWTIRNTAYNFKYMQWEENRPEMLFYHKIGSWHFGYQLDTIPGTEYNGHRLVFGRI